MPSSRTYAKSLIFLFPVSEVFRSSRNCTSRVVIWQALTDRDTKTFSKTAGEKTFNYLLWPGKEQVHTQSGNRAGNRGRTTDIFMPAP
jgi:hypothetical protein